MSAGLGALTGASTKKIAFRALHNCQVGQPGDVQNIMLEDLQAGCEGLIDGLFCAYVLAGRDAFFTVAVKAYGFALAELPAAAARIHFTFDRAYWKKQLATDVQALASGGC